MRGGRLSWQRSVSDTEFCGATTRSVSVLVIARLLDTCRKPCTRFLVRHLPAQLDQLRVRCVTGEREMKKRSQAVQRDLPRPYDVNMSVLRPMGANDPQLNELQRVGKRNH